MDSRIREAAASLRRDSIRQIRFLLTRLAAARCFSLAPGVALAITNACEVFWTRSGLCAYCSRLIWLMRAFCVAVRFLPVLPARMRSTISRDTRLPTVNSPPLVMLYSGRRSRMTSRSTFHASACDRQVAMVATEKFSEPYFAMALWKWVFELRVASYTCRANRASAVRRVIPTYRFPLVRFVASYTTITNHPSFACSVPTCWPFSPSVTSAPFWPGIT